MPATLTPIQIPSEPGRFTYAINGRRLSRSLRDRRIDDVPAHQGPDGGRVADLPDFENDFDRRVPARVMAVTCRMDPKLRNGNTLGCGRGQPIRWVVVWQYDRGKALGLDTFAGSQMPKSVNDAGFCGSYFYFRK